jgi:DNA-directed RNA polymerase specialized sigma24 family protein
LARPETLLFAIAKKIWLYQLRKDKRMPVADSEIEETADLGDMTVYMEREKQLQQMESVLRGMGDKCRNLLEMFYFLKLDMRTIAEKLKFRNDKVAKAMKYKCLEQARQLIKQYKHEGH